MLRAEQLALIQEANQQLLHIRRQEMDYYVSTFSSFGTQAALFGGFTLAAIINLNAESIESPIVWKIIFWMSTSFCMCLSLHNVLTTTFANIFGPNLALRGPSGSMVRAVRGMIAEREVIFYVFLSSVVVFQLMTLSSTWIVMKTYSSAICSAVLMIGGLCWYKYCLRIYNRFKFTEPDIDWKESPLENEETNKRKKSYSILPPFDKKHYRHKWAFLNLARNENTESIMSPLTENIDIGHPSKIWMEGYLDYSAASGKSASWERRFLVLKGSDLYFYLNREEFEHNPSKLYKDHSICLLGYHVATTFANQEYLIELQSEKDHYTRRFRCDTKDEMNSWVEAFQEASES